MNLFFEARDFCRLQARSLTHHVPPDCCRQPGFKNHRATKKCLWSALPTSTHEPHAYYHFSLVSTIIEITECISNQISEILFINPMKQIKISVTGDLESGQSKAVGVFKEIIMPASTMEVAGLAC